MEERIANLERALKRHRLMTTLMCIVTAGLTTWALVRGFRENLAVDQLSARHVKVQDLIWLESEAGVTAISPGDISVRDNMPKGGSATRIAPPGVSTVERQ